MLNFEEVRIVPHPDLEWIANRLVAGTSEWLTFDIDVPIEESDWLDFEEVRIVPHADLEWIAIVQL